MTMLFRWKHILLWYLNQKGSPAFMNIEGDGWYPLALSECWSSMSELVPWERRSRVTTPVCSPSTILMIGKPTIAEILEDPISLFSSSSIQHSATAQHICSKESVLGFSICLWHSFSFKQQNAQRMMHKWSMEVCQTRKLWNLEALNHNLQQFF